MIELKTFTVVDLLAASPSMRDVIAAQLETAARIIREGGRDDSAAWRLADAGLEFRRLIERSGEAGVIGVHYPTGMGAMLPKEPQE